jgi:Yip1 domain.
VTRQLTVGTRQAIQFRTRSVDGVTPFRVRIHTHTVEVTQYVARRVSYLTDPDGFLAQRADDPDWLVPVLLVVSAGVLPAVGSWYAVRQLAPPGAGTFVVISGVAGAAGALIGVVLVWVVGAAVFHGVSALFDGEGSFWRMSWLTGWGYLPAVLPGVASMVALVSAADALPAVESTR